MATEAGRPIVDGALRVILRKQPGCSCSMSRATAVAVMAIVRPVTVDAVGIVTGVTDRDR